MRAVLASAGFCVLALAAAWGGAMYGLNAPAGAKPEHQLRAIGLQYKKVSAINVPVIAEGAVKGYVILNIVFTADAETLARLPVPADAFVRDEAYRYIYNDDSLNFSNLSRYDVNGMIADVKTNVNKRLGTEVLNEIMLENINFIDKADVHQSKKQPSTP